MAQVFTWLVALLAIALIVWMLVRENDRRKQRTVEEWERDYAAGQGKMTQFIQAGGLGLDGILVSEKREAIQYQKDEEQGMTKTGNKGDDAGRTAIKE
jgi:hypothetical protein